MPIHFDTIYMHSDISWKQETTGKVVLLFPQNHPIQRFFRSVLKFSIPKAKELVLDEKTSTIWLLIDSEKTTREVYISFAKQIDEAEQKDLEVRFGTVIQTFVENGWIQERKQ